jgi:hypothetical protein
MSGPGESYPQPLYALPPAAITVTGGDAVTYAGAGRIIQIKLHTKQPATGSKLYAIRSLQLACAFTSGDLARGLTPREGLTWHTFRCRSEALPEVHRMVLELAEGRSALAAAYCDRVDEIIAEQMQELNAA